jgi:hypothetical protein
MHPPRRSQDSKKIETTLQKRIEIEGVFAEILRDMDKKCTNLNMTFWVKYLL